MSQTTYTNTLPLGSMLMEYQLDSVLGVGSFGITYHARDTLLELDVAIKEYFPAADVARVNGGTVVLNNTQHTEEYQTGLDSFLKEARTLASFSHPNIVRVKRYFKAHGTGYMVMDYEEGESLKTYLTKHPFPPEAFLKSLLGRLLDGAGKVHEVGFLHRDIKPENIYLRADGSPVLLDFGSARQTNSGTGRTLTALVTPGYAPFEQYTAKTGQGPWSDIYAMGGVLFFAVTGENPPDALTRMKEDTVAATLAMARGRYSDAFIDAVNWTLAIDEKKRPQNIAEWRSKILADASEYASPLPTAKAKNETGTGESVVVAATANAGTSPPTIAVTGPPVVVNTGPPTIPGPHSVAGTNTSPLDMQDISTFLDQREEFERALKARFQRVLTVMFTDIMGSTAIAETSGDIAVRTMLKRYHDLCLIAVKRHGGTLVKTIGDGSLSHFEAAAAACRAAADIQRGIEELNMAKMFKSLLLVRIGMHTGECIIEKNDIFGDVVNTASRFESSANPGEILVSEDTYNAIPDKSEFYSRFDREVTLKGKAAPFKAYIIFWDPKLAERDLVRTKDAPVVKTATPLWKIALYFAVPLLLILGAAIWVTGGEKFSGEKRRSIDHVLPGAK